MNTQQSQKLPGTVVVAAALLIAHGVLWLFDSLLFSMLWKTTRTLPFAFAGLVWMIVVAIGLVGRTRWAWWAGVISCGVFMARSAGQILLAFVRGHLDIIINPNQVMLTFFGFIILLSLALALLLSHSARGVFGLVQAAQNDIYNPASPLPEVPPKNKRI